MVHNCLEPWCFRCLALVRPTTELRVPVTLVRVVTTTLTIPESGGGLEESSRAAIFRTDISQHRPRAHVHARVEKQAVGLLTVSCSIFEFVLGHISHISRYHMRLRRLTRASIRFTSAFHDEDLGNKEPGL